MGMQGTPFFVYFFSFFSNYNHRRYHDEGGITLLVALYLFRCNGGECPSSLWPFNFQSLLVASEFFSKRQDGVFPFNFDVSSVRYFVSFHILNLIHFLQLYDGDEEGSPLLVVSCRVDFSISTR